MALQLSLDSHDPLPLYAQLERALKLAIATGSLAIGDRLPTVRQLAVDLQINANTVARVYAELERQGVLATRRGVGTFVLPPPAEASTASRAERHAELRALAERFLAEATSRGFTPQELLEQMHALCASLKEKSHGRR
jgi:GntR family transcriptional regulator